MDHKISKVAPNKYLGKPVASKGGPEPKIAKESHLPVHELKSILNKNSVFNLIFYLSFESWEWVAGNMSFGQDA